MAQGGHFIAIEVSKCSSQGGQRTTGPESWSSQSNFGAGGRSEGLCTGRPPFFLSILEIKMSTSFLGGVGMSPTFWLKVPH